MERANSYSNPLTIKPKQTNLRETLSHLNFILQTLNLRRKLRRVRWMRVLRDRVPSKHRRRRPMNAFLTRRQLLRFEPSHLPVPPIGGTLLLRHLQIHQQKTLILFQISAQTHQNFSSSKPQIPNENILKFFEIYYLQIQKICVLFFFLLLSLCLSHSLRYKKMEGRGNEYDTMSFLICSSF